MTTAAVLPATRDPSGDEAWQVLPRARPSGHAGRWKASSASQAPKATV
jgi:hypothetical protein